MSRLPSELCRRAVATALEEDLGPDGDDPTTDTLFPDSRVCTGRILARDALVLAGLPLAREVFRALDETVDFEASHEDGDAVAANTVIAVVRGDVRAVLRGERTALNFLMRLSGIAGAARAATEEIHGTAATILDTRKTVPGWRTLDKYAVALGGASNHRMGLFDAIMIKDTHLGVSGSIRAAVAAVLEKHWAPASVTVEVRDLAQLREAIEAGAGRALLDNMDLAMLREAVSLGKGRIVLEASGGLRPGRLRAVAETGVDFLSLGWLTHSAPAADLALEVQGGSGDGD